MKKIKSMLMIAILSIVFICGCTQTETKLPHENSLIDTVTYTIPPESIYHHPLMSSSRGLPITEGLYQVMTIRDIKVLDEENCQQTIKMILLDDLTLMHTAPLNHNTIIVYDQERDAIYTDLNRATFNRASFVKKYNLHKYMILSNVDNEIIENKCVRVENKIQFYQE